MTANTCPKCGNEMHPWRVGECFDCVEKFITAQKREQAIEADALAEKHKDCDKEGGSPYARGSADFYYRRSPDPHKRTDATGFDRIPLTDPDEIAQYHLGYQEQIDQKEW